MDHEDEEPGRLHPPHLRLVWSNPNPPAERRPVKLDVAIDRHLAGQDGLTDPEFLRLYSRR